jgi:hypothetical protein
MIDMTIITTTTVVNSIDTKSLRTPVQTSRRSYFM